MAYWRRYRKCSAEAAALALHESSSDGEVDEAPGSDALSSLEIGLSSICSPDKADVDDTCYFTSATSSTCDEEGAVCCLDNDASCHSEFSDEDFEVDVEDSSSPLSLRKDLAAWAIKHSCRRGPLNELLQILRREGHCLPKDSRTLLATPRKISTTEKCGGQYVYWGIEHGVR